MRHVVALAVAGLVSIPAAAVGRLADVSLIDRDTGQTLRAHYHKGEYWVAGRPGAHYAIQINSRDGRRLLAVTSVDGVNILTGEDAAPLQRGYVFDAWQGYGISGWRKSNSEIAAFTFTSIPKSYAARTGRPGNVGVIGVALFAEKQQAPQVSQVAPPPPPASVAREQRFEEAEVGASRSRGEALAGNQSADRAEADASAAPQSESRRSMENSAKIARPAPAPSLGTGHGRREYSSVTQVAFERAGNSPDEVIRIRYDSQDNLVALGVIRRPPPVGPRPVDPFPGTPRLGYVPDP